MHTIPTPYYLIDKSALLRNLETIDYIRNHSGAKVLLSLQCFAPWAAFDQMRQHVDGTTSSSLNDVKLCYQQFCCDTHAYSVAFAHHEMEVVLAHSAKISFTSVNQWDRFASFA